MNHECLIKIKMITLDFRERMGRSRLTLIVTLIQEEKDHLSRISTPEERNAYFTLLYITLHYLTLP